MWIPVIGWPIEQPSLIKLEQVEIGFPNGNEIIEKDKKNLIGEYECLVLWDIALVVFLKLPEQLVSVKFCLFDM